MNRRLEELERQASRLLHGEDIPFRASEVGDPRSSGYRKGFGIPFWAIHYRKTLGHDNAMHLKIVGDQAHLHREHVNPDDDLLGHLKQDMKVKHWVAVGLTALGAAGAFRFLSKIGR